MPQVGRMKTTFSKINYYRYKREQDERLNGQASVSGLTPQADQLLESARNAFQQGRNEDALANTARHTIVQVVYNPHAQASDSAAD